MTTLLRSRLIPWALGIVFFLLLIGIGLVGYAYYQNQRERSQVEEQDKLAAIAKLKVNQIAAWRKERIDDGTALMGDRLTAQSIRQWLAAPTTPSVKIDLLDWMTSLRAATGYDAVTLLDSQGAVLVQVPERTHAPPPQVVALAVQAARDRRVVLSDLHSDDAPEQIHLDLVVPLLAPQGEPAPPVAVLVARINPYQYLYPLIQSWPTPSQTAETLLVRREGNDVVFLNELRHRKNTALSLRFPISTERLPAAMALRGTEGIVEGQDYRGVPVFADLRAIPDSTWFMVAKVDATEVYAPMDRYTQGVAIVIAALVLAAGGGIGFLWRQQRAAFYRQQYAAERKQRLLAQRYETLSRYANDVILVTDRNGNIVDANERAADTYGYARSELLKLNLDDLRAPDSALSVSERIRHIEEENGLIFESAQVRKDGTRFPSETSARAIELDGEKYFLSIIRDITERKRAQALLAEQHAFLRQVMDTDPNYITVRDREGRYTLVNQAFADALGSAVQEIIGKHMRDVHHQAEFAARFHQEDLDVMNSRQELIIPEETFAGASGRSRWHTVVKRPIVGQDGNVNQVLCVVSDITERKQRERELQAVATVSTALRVAASRAEMLPVILDQLLELLQAQSAVFILREPLSGDALFEQGRGIWSHATGRRIPANQGVSGHVLATGQPYLTNDLPNDPHFFFRDMIQDLRAFAAVPLAVQQHVIGALVVGRQAPFSAGDIRLLTAIADIAANAFHRATLHEQTEAHLRRLTALRTIDQAISASLDLRVTFDILLDELTAQLRVDAADILLFNPALQTLEYAAGRGFRSRRLARFTLRAGQGYAGRIVLERRTLILRNLAQADGFVRAPQLANEGLVAYIGVPLIAKGEVKGVLEIFQRSELNPDQEWLDFAQTLAGQAAIALDNMQLFDGLQRSNTNLRMAYDATLEGWSRALDLRDKETEGHTRRVTEMTERLARAMGLNEVQLTQLRRGALLHDIGKMGIPDDILFKPGPLSPGEWRIMRQHPTYARELLSPIAYLHPALDIPYCHHEKWDGSGYPRGLRGEQIPLTARTFAVVDVWDALRSDRPYRKAWGEDKVREYIQAEAGKHFDPQVAEVFLRIQSQTG